MLKTPHRRIKVILRTLLIMCVLFFATLLICTIVFVLLSTTGIKILSPLTHTAINDQTSDSMVNTVKKFCQNNHLSCQSVITTDNETIEITLDSGGIIFVSTKKDIDNQLASLQRIMTQLTIKGKQFKKLDFRFDNVIVSF